MSDETCGMDIVDVNVVSSVKEASAHMKSVFDAIRSLTRTHGTSLIYGTIRVDLIYDEAFGYWILTSRDKDVRLSLPMADCTIDMARARFATYILPFLYEYQHTS